VGCGLQALLVVLARTWCQEVLGHSIGAEPDVTLNRIHWLPTWTLLVTTNGSSRISGRLDSVHPVREDAYSTRERDQGLFRRALNRTPWRPGKSLIGNYAFSPGGIRTIDFASLLRFLDFSSRTMRSCNELPSRFIVAEE